MTVVETDLHVPHWRPARSFDLGTLTASGLTVVSGAGLWVGICVEEPGNVTRARCVVGDGSGGVIAAPFGPYTLAAGESRSDMWPSRGVLFERGLTVVANVGSVAGSIWAIMLTRQELRDIHEYRQGETF